jgi:sphingomyelin phosphodiesterase
VRHIPFAISFAILNIFAQDNTQDPHFLPPRASDGSLLQTAISQLKWLFTNPAIANNPCTLCTAALQIAKFLSLAAPEQGPAFFVALCQQLKLSSSCNNTFGPTTLGPVLTQVLAFANVSGYDGQVRAVALEPRI